MKPSVLLLSLLTGLLLCSCNNYQNIRLHDIAIERFNMNSSTRAVLKLKVTVYNPCKSALKLHRAEGVLNKGQAHLADFHLLEKVKFRGGGLQTELVSLEIEIANLLGVFSEGISFNKADWGDLCIEGDICLSSGLVRKTYGIQNRPVQQLINAFL